MVTIVEPGWEFVYYPSQEVVTRHIEMARRDNKVPTLESFSISVRIFCSRGCARQIVTNQSASYEQELHRYCHYGKRSFQVIAPNQLGLSYGEYFLTHSGWHREWLEKPPTNLSDAENLWLTSIHRSYDIYLRLLEHLKPVDAGTVLPLASKTEVVMTLNLDMWGPVFQEWALNPLAQWEIREIFKSMYGKFSQALPTVFGEL